MKWIVLCLAVVWSAVIVGAESDAPFDVALEGVKSVYTDKVIDLGKTWLQGALKPESPADESNPVFIKCFSTPGVSSYVGIKGEMTVRAPLSRVDQIVSDIDQYAELFPDYRDIHVEQKSRNQWVTAWEKIIPVFFLPNNKYEVIYLIDHSMPNRTVYRYQLKKGGSIKTLDGIILLEPRGSDAIHYTQFVFFDTDFGLIQALAGGKIWSGAVEAEYLSGAAFKLKAENPDWSNRKIKDEAAKLLARFPVDAAIDGKKPFPSSDPPALAQP